ncbi:serine incorporator [Skeletonema marinoi]|uniref:Serine incorporator n=1 Tax=Skeletonema marinoi TaxID=267567 RepID=A0AAD8YPS9_9STRA|nr:serine incorporator [Skeletonema marinoi]
MGSAISSAASLAVTYCACSSASSICNACLGSTSPQTTGRRRSVLLLVLAVVLSLAFQYSLAPAILEKGEEKWSIIGSTIGKRMFNSWTSGCESYYSEDQIGQCAANAGVFRPTFLSFVFFVIAAVTSSIRPDFNRHVWPAKFTIYLLLVFLSIFASNSPWFSGVFLHIARIGATVFIVIQQIIIVDLAYNWNENWVGKADACDRLEWGSGAFWLRATIGACCAFYVMAFAGIGLMYHYFNGCGSNIAIITMTLLGIIAVTVLQLAGTEGSLLTSSVISAYAVYLAYSAVSKNPNSLCNPQLFEPNNTYDMSMGLVLAALSLAWTGWSYTANDRMSADGLKQARSLGTNGSSFRRGQDPLLDVNDPQLQYYDENLPPSGLALGSLDDDDDILYSHSSEVWKLNAILALICCSVAMTLTTWGSISGSVDEEGTHSAANPTVGKLNMIMIAISQWVALLLYTWTLVAPRLFPDRDFS